MSSSSSLSLSSFEIIQNPSSRTAVVGLGYTNLFSVSALSGLPISYKWQHSIDGGNHYFDTNPNGGVFTGARTNSLGVNAGMTDFSSVWNGAMFRCVLESDNVILISAAAVLTIKDSTCGGMIECGGTQYSADCGLPWFRQIDCTSCECVPAQFNTDKSSSSSSEFKYTGFLEIEVLNRTSSSSSGFSSTSSELLTVINFDQQNLIRIQTINNQEVNRKCYYLPFNVPCPERYYFENFVEGCEEPPCDKICCPIPTNDYDAMICGKAYSGEEEYNTPWLFHLDPESVSLSLRREVGSDSIINMLPSEIESLLLSGFIEQGTKCCFEVKNLVNTMPVSGVDYCEYPLRLRAIKTFSNALGKFIQVASCEGDCQNISGSYCLDDYIEQYSNELDAKVYEEELRMSSMTNEEVVASYIADIQTTDIDNLFDHAINFDNLDQAFASYSSSSSLDEEENFWIAFNYESDLISTNPQAPSELTLGLGNNYVFSKVGGNNPNNYFHFRIDSDLVLSALYTTNNSLAIQVGLAWDGQSILGEAPFDPNNLNGVLSSIMPLGQNEYVLKISSTDSEADYSLTLTVERYLSSSSSSI